jgi:predicted phage terminase large subunit-like protein
VAEIQSAQQTYQKMVWEPDRWLRYACKLSFKRFVQTFWEEVPGAGQLIWNWHMDVICDELQVVAERVFANKPKEYDLVVNICPGSSKSSLCSILFPAWCWVRMPSCRNICGSHSADLALDLATKCRDVLRSDLYQSLFPEVQVVDEQDTKAYYRFSGGGDRYTCTVGGRSPLGMHGHFQIIDDPIDPKKVLSELELQEARDFFTNQLPGRKVNRDVTVTILIMQRLGVGDPTDVMMEIGRRNNAAPVRLVCLPAELTEDVNPPELKERYSEEVMDHFRLPKHVLDRERATMGEHGYQTQFLQRASIPGGSMFRSEWFSQRVRAAPYNCKRVRMWDRASTADGGCYTAGVLMARDEKDNLYIEDVVHGQWEPDERNKKIRATALRDRARYGPKYEPKIYVEMEGGSSGRDAWKGVAKTLMGFPVREYRPTGSKDVRAEPWATQLAALNVYVVDGGESTQTGKSNWDINGYIQEHLNFRPQPGKRLGKLKDRVDSSSAAFTILLGSVATQGLRTYNLGKSRNGPPVKVMIATREQLADAHILNPAVMICIQDPPVEPVSEDNPLEIPPHAIASLLSSYIMTFADLDSYDRETNENWDTPDPDTHKKPSELAIDREQTKRMWATLLKKYATAPQLIIIQGEDDGRHISVALAICDALGFKRDQAIVSLGNPGNDDIIPKDKENAPNRYVYDVVRDVRRIMT